jgi:hypothetical protein
MTKEQTINKQILDMFNDSTYQGLKAYYEKTTVFNVLGVERNETRHSAFLCWLFNSNASHGLGEEPMKKLLRLYATKMKGEGSFRIMLMTGNYDLELDYHNLDDRCQNGGDAMTIFPRIKDMTPEEALATRKALLNYCKLDTWAMVKVWEKLKEVAGVI